MGPCSLGPRLGARGGVKGAWHLLTRDLIMPVEEAGTQRPPGSRNDTYDGGKGGDLEGLRASPPVEK